MTQTGIVVEKKEGLLTVAFNRPEACTHCNACGNARKCQRLTVEGEAEIGDTVTVETPTKNVLAASALGYAVPLAGLVAGLFIGSSLYAPLGLSMNADAFTGLCGVAAMGIAYAGVHWVDRAVRGNAKWKPKLIEVRKKEV